jgi:transglutaminase-like putative cysteine protease
MILNSPKFKKKTKLVIFLLTLLLSATLLSTSSTKANAAVDFTIDTDTKITYSNGYDYLTIKETVTIGVNHSSYYLPAGSVQKFEIPDFQFVKDNSERNFKTNSVSVKDKYGKTLSFTIKNNDDHILVTTNQNRDVNPGETFTFVFSYKTHELVDQTGNIYSLFIPGLPKNMKQINRDTNSLTTQYNYTTNVEIEGEDTEISYIQPETYALSPVYSDNIATLNIPTQQRIGNTTWLQIGTKQYYHFKMIQKSPKTDNITPDGLGVVGEYLSTNIFELPLPKEHPETSQKVYIESISPDPQTINRDDQGNLIAVFETPANEETEIIIEGYISLENSLMETQDHTLSEYFDNLESNSSALVEYEKYIQSDKYWESDSSAISEEAAKLKAESTSILDLISNNYDFVINHLEYSTSKLATDSNIRTGALSAYNGSAAVCMEYSDLAIALFRSQGIPARAAVGYGNDPTGNENSIVSGDLAKQEIGHQWVQVWIPEYGWYSVDPTWGESGRTYLGANLDHVLWLTMASAEDENLGGTSVSSADTVGVNQLSAYEVYMEALSQDEFNALKIEDSSIELSSYVNRYEDLEYSEVSYFLKGTLAGRAIIFIAPILGVILVVSALSLLIAKIAKKKSKDS